MYAANLIKENRITDAMELYVKYGTPAVQQVYGQNGIWLWHITSCTAIILFNLRHQTYQSI